MCCPGLEQTGGFLGSGLLPAALSTAFREDFCTLANMLPPSPALPCLFTHAYIHHHTFPGEKKKGGLKAGKGHEEPRVRVGGKEWAGKG